MAIESCQGAPPLGWFFFQNHHQTNADSHPLSIGDSDTDNPIRESKAAHIQNSSETNPFCSVGSSDPTCVRSEDLTQQGVNR